MGVDATTFSTVAAKDSRSTLSVIAPKMQCCAGSGKHCASLANLQFAPSASGTYRSASCVSSSQTFSSLHLADGDYRSMGAQFPSHKDDSAEAGAARSQGTQRLPGIPDSCRALRGCRHHRHSVLRAHIAALHTARTATGCLSRLLWRAGNYLSDGWPCAYVRFDLGLPDTVLLLAH